MRYVVVSTPKGSAARSGHDFEEVTPDVRAPSLVRGRLLFGAATGAVVLCHQRLIHNICVGDTTQSIEPEPVRTGRVAGGPRRGVRTWRHSATILRPSSSRVGATCVPGER